MFSANETIFFGTIALVLLIGLFSLIINLTKWADSRKPKVIPTSETSEQEQVISDNYDGDNQDEVEDSEIVSYQRKQQSSNFQTSEQSNRKEDPLTLIDRATLQETFMVNNEAFDIVYLPLKEYLESRDPKYGLVPEVPLGAFIKTPEEQTTEFNAFGHKRLDFLLLDKDGSPALAIEYHGRGHRIRNGWKESDAIKRKVLGIVGIKLIEVEILAKWRKYGGVKRSELLGFVEDALNEYETRPREEKPKRKKTSESIMTRLFRISKS